MIRSADFSADKALRWSLVREWDQRPRLLALMCNPSTAGESADDPTVTLLSYLASWNGFGGLVVVNAIPVVTPHPLQALAWLKRDARVGDLAENHRRIATLGAKHPDLLLAYGAAPEAIRVQAGEIIASLRAAAPHARLWCLGKTQEGHPIHPLARGKSKVEKTRRFVPWIS